MLHTDLGPRPAPIELDYDDLWEGCKQPHQLTLCELKEAMSFQLETCLHDFDKTLSDLSESDLFNEAENLDTQPLLLCRFLNNLENLLFPSFEKDALISALQSSNSSRDENKSENSESPSDNCICESNKLDSENIQQGSDALIVQTFGTTSTGLAGPLRKLSKRDTSCQALFTLTTNRKTTKVLLPHTARNMILDSERVHLNFKDSRNCYREVILSKVTDQQIQIQKARFVESAFHQPTPGFKIDWFQNWNLVLSVALTTVRAIITLVWCHYRVHAPFSSFDQSGRKIQKLEKSYPSLSWREPLKFILLRV